MRKDDVGHLNFLNKSNLYYFQINLFISNKNYS